MLGGCLLLSQLHAQLIYLLPQYVKWSLPVSKSDVLAHGQTLDFRFCFVHSNSILLCISSCFLKLFSSKASLSLYVFNSLLMSGESVLFGVELLTPYGVLLGSHPQAIVSPYWV